MKPKEGLGMKILKSILTLYSISHVYHICGY